MPAPRIRRDCSLEAIREEIVFPLIACQNDPTAADQAPALEAVLAKWIGVFTRQTELWDEQTKAAWRVASADATVDAHVMGFSRAVRAHAPDRFGYYFKQSPTETRRPVLGAELDTVKGWMRMLAEEKAPEVASFATVFEADVQAGEAASLAKKTAEDENRWFRDVGGLAQYLDEVEAARDKVYATLEARRVANPDLGLPRDWAATFFPGKRPAALSEDERRAKQAALELAREKRAAAKEAERAAKEKVKAAKRELQALRKKTR